MSTRQVPIDGGGSEWEMEAFHLLSEEQYAAIGEAMRQVQQFARADLLPYVQHSLASLLFTESQLAQEVSVHGPRQDFDIERANLALSCGILTVLSSLVLHQEQTLKKISAAHGSASPQGKAARDIFAAAYDNCYSYRFSCKLRQFIMHRSMGALSISTYNTIDARLNGLTVSHHSFEVFIPRNVLLAESDIWPSTLRREIANGPEKVCIITHIKKACDVAQGISGRTRELIFPDIQEKLSLLRELQQLFIDRAGTPSAVQVPNSIPRMKAGDSIDLSEIPLDFAMVDSVQALLTPLE